MSTQTSTYENEVRRAYESLTDYRVLHMAATPEELIALAQVHATLALAAAYHVDYEETVEIAHGAQSEDGRAWRFINPDAFTGSERADEVGA